MSLCLRAETVNGDGFKVAWQDDFENFQVFRVCNFAMANAWRLVDAGACLQPMLALAFVFKYRPALEHIDQLQ